MEGGRIRRILGTWQREGKKEREERSAPDVTTNGPVAVAPCSRAKAEYDTPAETVSCLLALQEESGEAKKPTRAVRRRPPGSAAGRTILTIGSRPCRMHKKPRIGQSQPRGRRGHPTSLASLEKKRPKSANRRPWRPSVSGESAGQVQRARLRHDPGDRILLSTWLTTIRHYRRKATGRPIKGPWNLTCSTG